ncbi:hypothetical protein GJAV_G00181840 [Gymnothorax javanicus]|nr:hypothetical protein GJAV_G00181840 [Gymnothorax javanicus]
MQKRKMPKDIACQHVRGLGRSICTFKDAVLRWQRRILGQDGKFAVSSDLPEPAALWLKRCASCVIYEPRSATSICLYHSAISLGK